MIPEDRVFFSLLHATFRAGPVALEVRHAWISRAVQPLQVEHVFAFTADDELSMKWCRDGKWVVQERGTHKITAVANWNAAATRARGQILIVIADDLFPPQAWDEGLNETVRSLDPLKVPFALKWDDHTEDASPLMRHPVLSREYYKRYGLFDPRFEGIAADDDFTYRAHHNGIVLDGRHIVLEHAHPSIGKIPSISHGIMLSSESADFGRTVFSSKWKPYQLRVWIRYFHPRQHQRRVSLARILLRQFVARLRYSYYLRSLLLNSHGN